MNQENMDAKRAQRSTRRMANYWKHPSARTARGKADAWHGEQPG
jgi:hypothetical protein